MVNNKGIEGTPELAEFRKLVENRRDLASIIFNMIDDGDGEVVFSEFEPMLPIANVAEKMFDDPLTCALFRAASAEDFAERMGSFDRATAEVVEHATAMAEEKVAEVEAVKTRMKPHRIWGMGEYSLKAICPTVTLSLSNIL